MRELFREDLANHMDAPQLALPHDDGVLSAHPALLLRAGSLQKTFLLWGNRTLSSGITRFLNGCLSTLLIEPVPLSSACGWAPTIWHPRVGERAIGNDVIMNASGRDGRSLGRDGPGVHSLLLSWMPLAPTVICWNPAFEARTSRLSTVVVPQATEATLTAEVQRPALKGAIFYTMGFGGYRSQSRYFRPSWQH
jgi:hypothetical protein